ncbi:MAG: protein-disulfide reductase DsbD family protein, partial [Planctomycetota bacterium]|nr:protein-disulfide reductase DsbD family protein [Planctomycetota bacterium]
MLQSIRLSWFWALLMAAALLVAPKAYAQPEVVKVTFAADRASSAPGGTVLIAVTYNHEEGWHIQPNKPVVPPELGDFEPYATRMTVTPPSGYTVGEIQWPKPIEVLVNLGEKPGMYQVYDHIAVALVPVTIPADASGVAEIKIKTGYQACNESTCVAPDSASATIKITIDA